MEHLLCWIEKHPGTAGWVQAIGALIALVLAIAIPAFQSSAARKSARRDAAQQFAAVIKIVQRGAFLVDEVGRAMAENDNGHVYFSNLYDRNRFELIGEAISKVEIHRLPTPGAVECFLDARRHYGECTSWIQSAYEECGETRAVSDYVREQFSIAHDLLFANWKWLDEELAIVETGKVRYDLRTATVAGQVIGRGRN